VQKRINNLKEWKTDAILQLRLLFDKLQHAVPISDFDSLKRNMDLQQQKNNSLQLKNIEMMKRNAELEKGKRKNKEAELTNEVNQDIKRQMQAEIGILTKRLERKDPIFEWENKIFKKLAQVFQRAQVTPKQAFDEFDVSKDGTLSSSEFADMIRKVLRSVSADMSQNELDCLWEALDVDNSGHINLTEFTIKMERFGLMAHSNDEHIMYQLIQAVERAGIKDLHTFFEVADKNGRGFITREDFADLFVNTKLKIDERELNRFMN
jgi:Ca2+-binding EF-hand superfamily protein